MKHAKTIAFLILPPLLASCGSSPAPDTLPSVQTVSVTMGTVADDIGFDATVEGKDTTPLAFKAAGRIASITADIGTRVRAGEVLATLGNEEASASVYGLGVALGALDNGIRSMGTVAERGRESRDSVGKLYDARIALAEQDEARAKLSVEIAQSDAALAGELERYGQGVASGSLANSDQAIDRAQKNLALAQTNYDAGLRALSGSTKLDSDAVVRAQADLDRLKNQLDNTQKSIAAEREGVRKSGLSSLTSAFLVARDARDFLDAELGVTNAYAITDQARYSLLGGKDSTSKENAKQVFRDFDAQYQTMLEWYGASIDGKPEADMETVRYGLEHGLDAMDGLRRALHAFSTVVEDSIAGSSLSQKEIDALKAETASRIASLEAVILSDTGAGMKGSLATLDGLDAKESLSVGAIKDAIVIAQSALESARTGQGVGADDATRNAQSLETNLKLAQNLAQSAANDRSVSWNDAESKLAALRTNAVVKQRSLELAKIALESSRKSIAALRAERDAKIAEASATIANADAGTANIRLNRAQIETQHALSQESLNSGILVAPYDGVIVKRLADPGAMVGAGTPVLVISREDARVARLSVESASKPSVGTEVTIESE
jgi:multidrug resistance efflux pump